MKREKIKLAIVTTHPIQYNAPLFRLLTERQEIEIRVFYTWSQSLEKVYDPGFAKERQWDIPLLAGYNYTFVENIAKNPGSHHFWGISNPKLITLIEEWKAEGILVYGWSFYSHLHCLWYFHKKMPVYFRGDSTLLDERIAFRTLVRQYFLKWVYRHVDTAFYVGENNKAYFLQHGLQESQLIYAPHAVENCRFAQLTGDETRALECWRTQLGLNSSHWVIFFIGKFEVKKNPFFLLELAAKMPEKNLRFMFVGNGELEYELKQKVNDERVMFLDFQNQSKMPQVYRLGNLLVLPSVGPGETWGLVANEAMASGLPVAISSKAGAASDLILDRVTGICFEPNETERVIAYIKYLKHNEDAYLQSKQMAQQHIQKFSIENVADAIETAVKSQK